SSSTAAASMRSCTSTSKLRTAGRRSNAWDEGAKAPRSWSEGAASGFETEVVEFFMVLDGLAGVSRPDGATRPAAARLVGSSGQDEVARYQATYCANPSAIAVFGA